MQNSLVTLNALLNQNKRLLAFQELSHKWHIQHHKNLQKIVDSVNEIMHFLDMKNSIKITEKKGLFEKKFTFPHLQRRLHGGFREKVQVLAKNNQYKELESLLMKVNDEEKLQNLTAEDWRPVFPVMIKWIESNQKKEKCQGLHFLRIAISNMNKMFVFPENEEYVNRLFGLVEKTLPKMEEIGFDPPKGRDIYKFLLTNKKD